MEKDIIPVIVCALLQSEKDIVNVVDYVADRLPSKSYVEDINYTFKNTFETPEETAKFFIDNIMLTVIRNPSIKHVAYFTNYDSEVFQIIEDLLSEDITVDFYDFKPTQVVK